MSNLFKEGNIFSFMGTTSGSVTAAVFAIICLCVLIVCMITELNLFELFLTFFNWLLRIFGGIINKRETKYHRDLEIGKIDEKRRTVKIYRFLNDLTIDLGIKQKGASPYEFLFIVIVGTMFADIAVCRILFGSWLMIFFLYPILFAGIMCVLYTKANVAHDTRIEDVIEAENIICNNIENGVVPAVKGSIDVFPKQLRPVFKDFLDNIEHKNYHIKSALMELNSQLGSIADDFIKKCIVFELEEEHGVAGVFRDIVELNNVKMSLRMEMKRKFEEVKTEFLMGAGMIFLFLAGVLWVYPDIRHFYFDYPIGQIILSLDLLLLVIEFVYITYLRAQEL